jgi:serine/threonine-protein kinase
MSASWDDPVLLPPDALVGRTIADRYAITAVVGRGGMGAVLCGQCLETHRSVAVKVTLPFAFTADNQRRLHREAAVAAAVRHPHLVEVYDCGVLDGGLPYVVMELLRGETLLERVRSARLSVADVVAVGIQLLSAVSAVNTHGFLHRDVKPSNVFVTSARGRSPTIKLIDFGLVKVLPNSRVNLDDGTSITATNMIAGTPNYISPERYLSCASPHARSDVWSVGLTLYEALAGRPAFPGKPGAELRDRILSDDLAGIHDVRPDVPSSVAAVIMRAVSKSVAHRFNSAEEFRAALVDAWSRHRLSGVGTWRGLGRAMTPAPGSSSLSAGSRRPVP